VSKDTLRVLKYQYCQRPKNNKQEIVMITTWKVTLGSPHTVQVDHIGMSGKLMIKVDGKEILQKTLSRGDDFEYQFVIKEGIFQKGKPCLLRIVYKLEQLGGMGKVETWDYELLVDGVKQKAGAA
jgi:hypothetical protein